MHYIIIYISKYIHIHSICVCVSVRLELGSAAGGPGMALEAEALLNATGRRPRTEELDLEAAGIQCHLVDGGR